MRDATRVLLTILIPAGAAPLRSEAESALSWPFDPPVAVTSSFGEFRQGHFHGGVDLSTSQRTGREVRAAADGWVWRVRASGAGYGRALYCRLDDGRTAVYAHLGSFAPEIDAFVAAAQESLSRYEVDLYPAPGRLPFHRGDVVARSGESGAGPPHLHFEIRSGGEAATGLNPLRQGLAAADTTPPLIRSLGLEPYGAGAAVDGGNAARSFAPVMAGAGMLRLRATPRITNGALLTLDALDPAATGNRLGVYRASLSVDGAVRYAVAFDAFDWERPQEVELAYDWDRARRGHDFVLNLYRPPGATDAVFGSFRPLAGLLATDGEDALGSGPHEAEIVVEDAAGNATCLRFSFELEREDPALTVPAHAASGPIRQSAAGRVEWDVTVRGNAVDVKPRAGRRPAEDATVTLVTPVGERSARFASGKARAGASLPIPEGLYAPVALVLSEGGAVTQADTLDLAVVTRGPATALSRRGLTLDAPARAFFGPGAVEFVDGVPAASPGLVPRSRLVTLRTGHVVLDRAVTVRLAPVSGAVSERTGLYRLTDGGSWDWIGSTSGPGGVSGETRYLTAFAVFDDVAPPTVGAFRPGPGQVVAGPRPALFAGIADQGSGFTWRDIEAVVDGVPQIVVYDPESGTLNGRSRRDLAKGVHTWSVTVKDRAGHITTRSATFTVRP